ncbi:MAG: hypothetical protein ACYS29_02925, partial [Planctomycetota bacterium]
MKSGIALTIFLIVQAKLAAVGFGASGEYSGEAVYLLPWQMMVEIVDQGNWIGESKDLPGRNTTTGLSDPNAGLDPNRNCAYEPDKVITMEAPTTASSSLEKIIDVDLDKWLEGRWQYVSKATASIESNLMRLSSGIGNEGFFRLRFVVKVLDGGLRNFETYAIVSHDWKRSILTFCRKLKEEVESDRDAQLVRASIATSHFDHTMEMVSAASSLTGRVLKALAVAVRSKRAFNAGECPDLVIGSSRIRVKRFPGGPTAEFVLRVPSNYDDRRKYPVFVHVTGEARYEDMIDLQWPSIDLPQTKLQWKEYMVLFGIMKEKLNIDEDRIYINGECGAGIPAMELALRYPDHWAECSASTGNSFRHLAGNALNLPFIFCEKHSPDEASVVAYSEFAAECFEYYGCRQFKYIKGQTTVVARGTPAPVAVRERNPQRVLYTIDSLHNPNAYWVKAGGRADENLLGTIDACVWGQTVLVTTENIDAYSLDLSEAPIDTDRPIEIIENGQSLGLATDIIFSRRSKKYNAASYIKNERLHGPVRDAFTDPYVVVYGRGGEHKEFCEISGKIAASLARDGPYFGDTDMPSELVKSHNLILVGTRESNRWLAQIADELPVQIKDGAVCANGQRYEADDVGFFFIYPNPLNSGRYVAVFSATSSAAMAKVANVYWQISSHYSLCEKTPSYSRLRCIQPIDVGIFELAGGSDVKWHILERFSTVWGWHSEWDQELAVTNKKHAKWRWRQWVARVIREQLEADVAVCENPFRFARLEPDVLVARNAVERDALICEDPSKFLDTVSA